MSTETLIVFIVLLLTLVAFIWGRFRHDIVAISSLLILIVTGNIEPERAFEGFAHPAVITVAAVLIVSAGLKHSGLIDVIGKLLTRIGDKPTLQVAALCAMVCVASAFMNNVGALAVLMPVAIHMARKSGRPPSLLLMPLAFSSLLGGMITLIGTPPNIIIAAYRGDEAGKSFSMFDFAPVGMGLAIVGLLFIVLIGWRLIPRREGAGKNQLSFEIDDYITEVRVTKDSKILGLNVNELNDTSKSEVILLGFIRDNRLMHAPSKWNKLREGDILIIEADSDELKKFVNDSGTEMVGTDLLRKDAEGSDELRAFEVVVMNDSPIVDRTASGLQLRERYGVNLLALARSNIQRRKRIDHMQFKPGDVLLIQGYAQGIDETVAEMGCLPLADRNFTIGKKQNIILGVGIFAAAIATVLLGWLNVEIAFMGAALGMVLTRVLPIRHIYTSVDWPVIVLLGAMIPVGAALEDSGGAEYIASLMLDVGHQLPTWGSIAALLVTTMLLSNVINNAATAVLMAPIAIGLASGLNLSSDAFLMTIAIGASATFLTPIGHQSNTLIMGPGGYKFRDFLNMGIPMTILVAALAVPLIMYFWPANL
ncbi:MAG: SLC13 family permease [Cryomorphaceae bacterium]|nr:MAG: SLC13 family permease [Cryomorphaceae bacterium]